MELRCKICQRIISLDETGNSKEKYIQCTCGRIFLNPFYKEGELIDDKL